MTNNIWNEVIWPALGEGLAVVGVLALAFALSFSPPVMRLLRRLSEW